LGDDAFRGTAISSIHFPPNITDITGFKDCRALSTVTIDPSSAAVSIRNNAFSGCSALTSFTIPASITTIGTDAFFGTAISSIYIPPNVTPIKGFRGCSNLSTVTIDPSSAAVSIGDNAFASCGALTSFTIPSTTQSIGERAFYACGLNEFTYQLPTSLISIGAETFASSSLPFFTIPDSVQSFGERIFANCYISIRFNCRQIPADIFANSRPNTIIIGPLITDISSTLLEGADNSFLTAVLFDSPSSVTRIDDSVFNGCLQLSTITFPSSAISFGQNVFTGTPFFSTLLQTAIPQNVQVKSTFTKHTISWDPPVDLSANKFDGYNIYYTAFTDAGSRQIITSDGMQFYYKNSIPTFVTLETIDGIQYYRENESNKLFTYIDATTAGESIGTLNDGKIIPRNIVIATAIQSTSYIFDVSFNNNISLIYVSCNNILSQGVESTRTLAIQTNLINPSWFETYLQNPVIILRELTQKSALNNYFNANELYNFSQDIDVAYSAINFRMNNVYAQIFGYQSKLYHYALLCSNAIKSRTPPPSKYDVNWQLFTITLAWILTDMIYLRSEPDNNQLAQKELIEWLPKLANVGATPPAFGSLSAAYLSVEILCDLEPNIIALRYVGAGNIGFYSDRNCFRGFNIYLNDILVSQEQEQTTYSNYDLSDNTVYSIQISAVSTNGVESEKTTGVFNSNKILPTWWPTSFSTTLEKLPNTTESWQLLSDYNNRLSSTTPSIYNSGVKRLLSLIPQIMNPYPDAPILQDASSTYFSISFTVLPPANGTVIVNGATFLSISGYNIYTTNGNDIQKYTVDVNDPNIYDLISDISYNCEISAVNTLGVESTKVTTTVRTLVVPTWWPLISSTSIAFLQANLPKLGLIDESRKQYYSYSDLDEYNTVLAVFNFQMIRNTLSRSTVIRLIWGICFYYNSVNPAQKNMAKNDLITYLPLYMDVTYVPPAPTNLINNRIGWFNATISWTRDPIGEVFVVNNDNRIDYVVVGYNIYLNSSLLSTNHKSATFSIYTLEANTAYQFEVAGLNHLGIEGPKTAINLTTPAQPTWWPFINTTSVNFLQANLPPISNIAAGSVSLDAYNNIIQAYNNTNSKINLIQIVYAFCSLYSSDDLALKNIGTADLLFYLPLYIDPLYSPAPTKVKTLPVNNQKIYSTAIISWMQDISGTYILNNNDKYIYDPISVYYNVYVNSNLASSQQLSAKYSTNLLEPDTSYQFEVAGLNHLGIESQKTSIIVKMPALPTWWKNTNRTSIINAIQQISYSQLFLDPSSNDQGSAAAAIWRQQNPPTVPIYTLRDCINYYLSQTPPNNLMLKWIYFDLLPQDISGEASIWLLNNLPVQNGLNPITSANTLEFLKALPNASKYINPQIPDQTSAVALAWRNEYSYIEIDPTLQECIDYMNTKTLIDTYMLSWMWWDNIEVLYRYSWLAERWSPGANNNGDPFFSSIIFDAFRTDPRFNQFLYPFTDSSFRNQFTNSARIWRRKNIYRKILLSSSQDLLEIFLSQTPIDYEKIAWINFDTLQSQDNTVVNAASSWTHPGNRHRLFALLESDTNTSYFIDPSSNDQTTVAAAAWRLQNIYTVGFNDALFNLIWQNFDKYSLPDPETNVLARGALISYLGLLISSNPPIITNIFVIYKSLSVRWIAPDTRSAITGNTLDIIGTYNVYLNNISFSSNQATRALANYDLSANVSYVIQIGANNILGQEGELTNITITERDDLPSWWSWNFPSILQALPNASRFTSTDVTNQALWRLQNIFSTNVGPTASLQDCAAFFEALLPRSIDNMNYITLIWLYVDMCNSTDTATHNQGVDGMILRLPYAKGVVKAIQFSDGGPDELMSHIPAEYFASSGNAMDGSVMPPNPLYITHSAKLNRIDPNAFGTIERVVINGVTYEIEDGDIQVAPQGGIYTININGADILLPVPSQITFDTYTAVNTAIIPIPRYTEYIPRDYFSTSSALTVTFPRWDDKDIVTMELNCLPPYASIVTGGSPSIFYTPSDPSYRTNLCVDKIFRKKLEARYDYGQYLQGFTLQFPEARTYGLDLAEQSFDLYANTYSYVNEMNYTDEFSAQVMTVYGGIFYSNFDVSAEIIMVPLNARAGSKITMAPTLHQTLWQFSALCADPLAPILYDIPVHTGPDNWDMTPNINEQMSNEQVGLPNFGLPNEFTDPYMPTWMKTKNVDAFSANQTFFWSILYDGLQYQLARTGTITGPLEAFQLNPSRNPIVGRLKLLNLTDAGAGNFTYGLSLITIPQFVADSTKFKVGPLLIPNKIACFNNFAIQDGMDYYFYGIHWINRQVTGQSIFVEFQPGVTVVGLMSNTFTFVPYMFNDISGAVTAINWRCSFRTSVPHHTFFGCRVLGMYPIDMEGSIGVSAFEGCALLPSLSLIDRQLPLTIYENAFKGCSSIGSVLIASIEDITLKSNAFTACNAIQTVNLSSTTSIDISGGAFANLASLTTLQLAAAEVIHIRSNAFSGCTQLQTMTLSSTGTMTINSDAFAGCIGLTSLDISCGSLFMDLQAFRGCTNLATITITAANTVTYNFAQFLNLQTLILNIGTAYTEIAPYTNISSLRRVKIQSPSVQVTPIQFGGCTGLQYVEIATLRTVNCGDMFKSCNSLIDVSLNAISSAIDSSFNAVPTLYSLTITGSAIVFPINLCINCPVLFSVSLVGVQSSFNPSAFTGCSSLNTLTVNNTNSSSPSQFNSPLANLTTLQHLSIRGTITITPTNLLVNSIISLLSLTLICTLTGAVTYGPFPVLQTCNIVATNNQIILPFQFALSPALTSVTISPVTDISDGAFFGCSALITLNVFQEGLLTIGSFAFANTGVTTPVTIPSTLVDSGGGYFAGCPNLTSITYLCDVMQFTDPTRITGDLADLISEIPSHTYKLTGSISYHPGIDSSEQCTFIKNAGAANAQSIVLTNTLQYIFLPLFNLRINKLNELLPKMHPLYNLLTSLSTYEEEFKVHLDEMWDLQFSGRLGGRPVNVHAPPIADQWAIIQTSMTSIHTALEPVPTILSSCANFIQSLQTVAELAYSINGQIPKLNEIVNWDPIANEFIGMNNLFQSGTTTLLNILNTVLTNTETARTAAGAMHDAANEQLGLLASVGSTTYYYPNLPGTLTYYQAYLPVLYTIPSLFQQIYEANQYVVQDFAGGDSTAPATSNYSLDYATYSLTLSTDSIMRITGFPSITIDPSNPTNILFNWISSCIITLFDKTEIDISGTMTLDIGINYTGALSPYKNILLWIYNNTINLSAPNDISFTFDNNITNIENLDNKSGGNITINSNSVNLFDSAMCNLQNVTLTVYADRLYLYNNVFANCTDLSLNIVISSEPTAGVFPAPDIFMGSSNVFVNSNQLLINRPIVQILNIGNFSILDASNIIEAATGIPSEHTRDVCFSTLIQGNSSKTNGIPMITFQTTADARPAFTNYALIADIEEWFWCYRVQKSLNGDRTIRVNPDSGVTYEFYKNKPTIPAAAIGLTYNSVTEAVLNYIWPDQGDPVSQMTGLTSSFAPENFKYYGAKFTRTYSLATATATTVNPDPIKLRPIKTNDHAANDGLNKQIGNDYVGATASILRDISTQLTSWWNDFYEIFNIFLQGLKILFAIVLPIILEVIFGAALTAVTGGLGGPFVVALIAVTATAASAFLTVAIQNSIEKKGFTIGNDTKGILIEVGIAALLAFLPAIAIGIRRFRFLKMGKGIEGGAWIVKEPPSPVSFTVGESAAGEIAKTATKQVNLTVKSSINRIQKGTVTMTPKHARIRSPAEAVPGESKIVSFETKLTPGDATPSPENVIVSLAGDKVAANAIKRIRKVPGNVVATAGALPQKATRVSNKLPIHIAESTDLNVQKSVMKDLNPIQTKVKPGPGPTKIIKTPVPVVTTPRRFKEPNFLPKPLDPPKEGVTLQQTTSNDYVAQNDAVIKGGASDQIKALNARIAARNVKPTLPASPKQTPPTSSFKMPSNVTSGMIKPAADNDLPNILDVIDILSHTLYKSCSDEFSSSYDFDVMVYHYQDKDPLMQNVQNISLYMLGSYTAMDSLGPIYSMNGLGKVVCISTPLMSALFTAKIVDTPLYRGMSSAPEFPVPISDVEGVTIQPRSNYQGQFAHYWQIQYYLSQGTIFDHEPALLDETGYPSQVLLAANPLLTLPGYLWKNTYLGPVATSGTSVYINTFNQDGYGSTILCVLGNAQSELYLGSRTVSYDVQQTPVNHVYNGVTNLSVNIPSSITSIPDNAFCSSDGTDGFYSFSINTVTMNSNLSAIGQNAFKNTNIKHLYLLQELPNFTDLSSLTYLDLSSTCVISLHPDFTNLQISGSLLSLTSTNKLNVSINGASYDNRFNLLRASVGTSYNILLTDIILQNDPTTSWQLVSGPPVSQNGAILTSNGVNITITPNTKLTISLVPRGIFEPSPVAIQLFNAAPKPSVDLPSSTIGDYAFSSNKYLTEVPFPDNCISIGANAFSYMTSLQRIVIPDTVLSIDDEAFANSALSIIKLPASLTETGINIFLNNGPLQVIITTVPPAISAITSQLPAGSTIFVLTQEIKDQIQTQGVSILVDSPPAAPTDLSAEPLDGSIIVSWSSANSLGGSPIESYTLDISGIQIKNVNSPYTLEGLVNRLTYTLSIRATNASGLISSLSDAITLTPMPATQILTDLSTDAPYALFEADITLSSHDQGTINGCMSDNTSVCIYSASGPMNIYEGPTFMMNSMVTGLHYILVSNPSLSLALQTFTGSDIPLTLVKTGTDLNSSTGRISSCDTGLQVFTVEDIPVMDDESITLRNIVNPRIDIKTNDPDATVLLQGANDLKEGANTLTATILAADGETTEIYTITINLIQNTYSTQTLEGLTAALMPRSLIGSLQQDISNNQLAETQILTSFIQSVAEAANAIPLLLELASQIPSSKALTNTALLEQGLTANEAYPLSGEITSSLLEQIPDDFRDLSYNPTTLALLIPDATHHIVVDMAHTDVMISLVPGTVYQMTAVFDGVQSTGSSTVTYVRTDTDRYFTVDGNPYPLVLFTFPQGPQRYLLLKAFGSPIGFTGILSPFTEAVAATTRITLSPEAVNLRIGTRARITAQIKPESTLLVWTSSDSSCVTVNQSGTFTAVGGGRAIITATTLDGSVSAHSLLQVVPN
jgi:hypothetical protein